MHPSLTVHTKDPTITRRHGGSLDYTIEDWPGYSVLAITGPMNQIPRLWQQVTRDLAAGRLKPSREAALIGTSRGVPPAMAYLAGVIAVPGTTCEGYDRIEIPRGRYAVAHMRGLFTNVPAEFNTLAETLKAARCRIDGFGVEVYYGDPDGPDARYDLCFRVSEP